MAPLKIPTVSKGESDFPIRLEGACSGGLESLKEACADIKGAKELTPEDLKSLRVFFAQPILKESVVPAGVIVPPPVPSSGSLESDIIQGLAQFVYDRAKAEATLYFTKQLSKGLCEGDHRLFFPSICMALADTTPSIPLGAMGTYLAAAARTDLDQFPDRTLAYTLHGLSQDKVAQREGLFGGRIVLAYYKTVRSGRKPLDVARSLHAIQVPDAVVGSKTTVLKATRLASELIDAIQAQKGWDQVKLPPAGIPDPRLTYYALGAFFTFERSCAADQISLGTLPDEKIAATIPVIAGFLVDAAVVANRVDQTKAALAVPPPASSPGSFQPAKPTTGSASGATALSAGSDAIEAAQAIDRALHTGVQILIGLGIPIGTEATTALVDVDVVTQVGQQLVDRHSPADLVILTVAALRQLTSTPAGAPPPRAIADIQQLLALIAQLADSKSADEVNNAITAAAAPPSTYELKYQKSMVTIGAMAGASAGYEILRTDGLGWSGGAVIGAFAPVGLTWSVPFGSYFHGGAMLSVVNLGALISARFAKDVKTSGTTTAGTTTMTVETQPQVKLANVLAPGLFFSFGLGKSPFVLSLGSQVIPIGREVSTVAPDGTTTTSTTPAIQFLGALSVDVPIFVF
jgi:hypothetical protein